MAFLLNDNQVSVINADSIQLVKQVPIGIYKTCFSPRSGTYLEKTQLKLSHGKIYGDSQSIANHIVTAFKKSPKEKNLGVLLSGGRGLGKTLTTRLVIEQLKDECPIITISEYSSDLSDFLTNISGCVILMDEFEKFMSGNTSKEENSMTKQESLLSIFDGNTNNKGNLFLLTVNEVNKLNENLLSRPGRIRYNFKYESESGDVIRAYCEDNLDRKELIPEIITVLSSARYVSMDIISAFVQELNDFPNLTPRDIQRFFNIEQDSSYTFKIYTEYNGHEGVFATTFNSLRSRTRDWIYLEPNSLNDLKKQFKENGELEEDEDFEDSGLFPHAICYSIEQVSFPSFVIGSAEIDADAVTIESTNSTISIDNIHITKVVLIDKKGGKEPKSKMSLVL